MIKINGKYHRNIQEQVAKNTSDIAAIKNAGIIGYEAGDGIDIDEGVISVDTDVIQEKIEANPTTASTATLNKLEIDDVVYALGGSGPEQYIKNASVSGNTLTLTKLDDTTVGFTPSGSGGITDVKVDATSVVTEGVATIPKASTTLGVVKGVAKSTETTEVAIDSDGKMWYTPGGGSGGGISNIKVNNGNVLVTDNVALIGIKADNQNIPSIATGVWNIPYAQADFAGVVNPGRGLVNYTSGDFTKTGVMVADTEAIDNETAYNMIDAANVREATVSALVRSTGSKAISTADKNAIKTNLDISSGGEPAAYIKNASVNGNTLTLTKKDDTTVVFTPSGGGAVDSVNGHTGVVVLDAEDVGALPSSTSIPTKTSQLTNDSGFLTQHQSLSAYRTAADLNIIDAGKQATLTPGAGIDITNNSISVTSCNGLTFEVVTTEPGSPVANRIYFVYQS